jgi:hypothetical protein
VCNHTLYLCSIINSEVTIHFHDANCWHPSSSLVFSGVHCAQSLVFCVVFYRSLFVIFTFSFDHCVVCPSLIYESDYPFILCNFLILNKYCYIFFKNSRCCFNLVIGDLLEIILIIKLLKQCYVSPRLKTSSQKKNSI